MLAQINSKVSGFSGCTINEKLVITGTDIYSLWASSHRSLTGTAAQWAKLPDTS